MLENYFKRTISLEEGEEIKEIIHHHFFSFFGTFFRIALFPFIFIVFVFFFGFGIFESILDSPLLSLIFLTIMLIWGTYSFYSWYIWFFDVAIITNKKVILVEQKKLFDKKVSAASLSRIQDVSVNFRGVSQNLFRYGTVSIQTAGEEPNLQVVDAPNPQEVLRKILNIRDNENDGLQKEHKKL